MFDGVDLPIVDVKTFFWDCFLSGQKQLRDSLLCLSWISLTFVILDFNVFSLNTK
jgi:hypothetical protein